MVLGLLGGCVETVGGLRKVPPQPDKGPSPIYLPIDQTSCGRGVQVVSVLTLLSEEGKRVDHTPHM